MRQPQTHARSRLRTRPNRAGTRAGDQADLMPHEEEAERRRKDPMRATTVAASVTESSWITPRQAAAYLGVGVDTIYEACAAADLKHVKLGYRTIRLRREWIDHWAEKHAT